MTTPRGNNFLAAKAKAKAKSDPHQIWLAETWEMATKAFDHFPA